MTSESEVELSDEVESESEDLPSVMTLAEGELDEGEREVCVEENVNEDLESVMTLAKEDKIEFDEDAQNCILSFITPSEFTDITLVVEGRKLYASKHLLYLSSPVFATMLTVNMAVKYTGKIPLPDKKFVDVLLFLVRLHPKYLKPITAEDALRLYPLYHEFQMTPQLKDCEITLKNAIENLYNPNQKKFFSKGKYRFHHDCVLLSYKYSNFSLFESLLNCTIRNGGKFFDCLIDSTNEMPSELFKMYSKKMKEYLHRR